MMPGLGKIWPKKKTTGGSKLERSDGPAAEVEKLGLFLLKDNTDAVNNLDIIAVHGLGGHWRDTWTENERLWLRDSVPSKFQDYGMNVRVFSYGYNSSTAFSKAITDITDEAAMLLDRIKGERKLQAERHRPIIFIAHSLGGILVKKAMIIAHERFKIYGELLNSIKAAMFLGTPHRGSDAAYWATYAANALKILQLGRGTNSFYVSALQKNSTEFANISQQWIERAAPRKIRTFYETDRLLGEIIVDKDSAKLGIVNEIAIGVAGANHRSICKFSDFDSQKYKPIWNATEELAQYALGTKESSISNRLKGEDFIKKIILPLGVKLANSNPPASCDKPPTEGYLDWFTKSPEYTTWAENEGDASLWLHGLPGDGKTFIMAYVRKSLSERYLYTKKRDVISVFCSSDDSEAGLVASLAFQLIQKNEDRAQIAQEKIPFTNILDKQADNEFERNMWKLLEALNTVEPNHEAVILIDGIDKLSPSIRDSFLGNFLAFQKNVQRRATIRILISSTVYPGIGRAFPHYSSIEMGKERKECLATIFFQEWNARETRIETVTDGGSWLSSNSAYQGWDMDPEKNLLWVEGKPGSGKSTLLKHIVGKIRDERTNSTTVNEQNPVTLENETTIIAEFYYSFRGGFKETSHELMLRSIVYQIWKQNYRLFLLIQSQYQKLRETKKMPWSYDDLKLALESLHLTDFDLKVIIVVDAMDESVSHNRNDVLDFLSLLSSRKSRCNIRLLIASRPEIRPKLHVGQFSHIILQKENNVYIQIVVDDWIKSHEQAHNRQIWSDIRHYIVENSAGVFLWVTLVLRDLDRYIERGAYRETGLRDRLRSLPKELGGRDGYYRLMIDSLLDDHDQDRDIEEKIEDGQRTLAWTTFAKQPLDLVELGEVLAVPPPSKRMDPSSYSLEMNRPHQLEQGLFSLCGGLVELRETEYGQIVQLIHQTVREFLLDRKPSPPAEPYHLDETRGDFEIAYTCCRYLRIVFEASIPLMEIDSKFSQIENVTEHLSSHPLLTYAIDCFNSHLDHLNSGKELTRINDEFENLVTAIGKKSYSSFILSRWITTINLAHLQRNTNESSVENCLSLSLTWAAGAGKDQVVSVLCVLGANFDNFVTFQHDNQTSDESEILNPLMNAARQGHISTILSLLAFGANINAQGGKYGNALQAALTGGYEAIVELLLHERADVNVQGGEYGNALQAASAEGHETIVRLLLNNGASVNAQGGKYGNAFQAASAGGHHAIMQLLLKNGADANT